MKFTNQLGLPEAIVKAVTNDEYDRGSADISITGLLRPPRLAALELQHESELEQDVSDRLWSLYGQVIHGILERSGDDGIAEKRFFMDIAGWKVSGQIDRLVDGVLHDYKFVTAWKFKDGKPTEEFEQQMNGYAELLRQNNHEVRELRLTGILRDWSKLEAMRSEDYPRKQVVSLPVPMWDRERAYAFLRERVILHQQARVSLPECTAEERWSKPTRYAVMKKGKERAVKLWDDRASAERHASESKDLFVEDRPGVHQRCEFYCSVANFCSQFQTLKGENK